MRDLLHRTEQDALESGDHIPVPLTHRGPDTVRVEESGGELVAFDRENPDAWLAYTGCVTEAVN